MKYVPSIPALLVLTLGLPREFAIYGVPPLMLLLLFEGRRNIMQDSARKLALMLLLVIPAYFASSARTTETARLASLGLLIAIFPYRGIRLTFLREAGLVLMAYVLVFQIGILLGYSSMMAFRERFYPISDNHWEEATLAQVYEGFRVVRAAGLFYNPNVMAQVVFFPYVIATLCLKKPFSGAIHAVLATLAFGSIALTGSRVYSVAMVLIVLLNTVKTRALRMVMVVVMAVAGLEFIREFILNDFSSSSGSMATKLTILSDYLALNAATPLGWIRLLWGGTYDIPFDADVGYLIGAWGFLGFGVSVAMVVWVCRRFSGAWRVVMPIYLTSFANSLFFSLLNAPLFVVTILAVAKYAEKKQRLRGEFVPPGPRRFVRPAEVRRPGLDRLPGSAR
jgi:hypothetical protein